LAGYVDGLFGEPGSDRFRQIDLHAALGEFARELTLVVIELRARPVAFVAIECEAELDRCCRPLTCLDREGVARLYRRAKPLGVFGKLSRLTWQVRCSGYSSAARTPRTFTRYR
jgi:hypothetical protein